MSKKRKPNIPQVTLWYTGELVKNCDCAGPYLAVYTDGRYKYARCETCNRTWKAKTFDELAEAK
jgi:hypothetical protein